MSGPRYVWIQGGAILGMKISACDPTTLNRRFMWAKAHLIANIYVSVPLADVDVGVAGRMLALCVRPSMCPVWWKTFHG